MEYRNQFDSLPQWEAGMRVHHLGIGAADIAPGVILTSNLERVHTIASVFDEAVKVGEHREYITYTGKFGSVPVSAMSIGNGCMPTAIAVEELRHIGCRIMIKVGSCSSIQEDLKPGTVILPVAAVRDEGATIEYVNLQYPAVADLDVFFALLDSAAQRKLPVAEGVVRTHDALFMGSLHGHDSLSERVDPWRRLGVLAFDNEVAALFTIASVLGSRAGALLVVTDNLVTGECMDFETGYPELMHRVIMVALESLQKLHTPGGQPEKPKNALPGREYL